MSYTQFFSVSNFIRVERRRKHRGNRRLQRRKPHNYKLPIYQTSLVLIQYFFFLFFVSRYDDEEETAVVWLL